MSNVIPPEAMITHKSAGARTSLPNPLKNTPEPKRYKLPLSNIISPIYIARVVAAERIAGSATERNLRFPGVKEARKTPVVTPRRIKNADINAAETADTVISPVR